MGRWLILFVVAATGLFSKDCFVNANNAKFFCRVMGEGTPIIVIHGGPGLSQDYLLPGMERLAEHCKVFYDQREREGRKILERFLSMPTLQI